MSPHAAISNADSTRWFGIGTTIAIHASVLAVVLAYVPARDALQSDPPLMVRWITPESKAAPAPKATPRAERIRTPVPAQQVQPRLAPEPPNLATQTPVPVPSLAPASNDPKPSAPAETLIAPSATPTAAATAAPIVPPGFNAAYLDNPAPLYPPLARRMGEEGRVMLRVYVEASGLPSKVEIRTSSGSERLDHAALEAVRRWKFVPARQGDLAVPAFVVVPVSFSLKG